LARRLVVNVQRDSVDGQREIRIFANQFSATFQPTTGRVSNKEGARRSRGLGRKRGGARSFDFASCALGEVGGQAQATGVGRDVSTIAWKWSNTQPDSKPACSAAFATRVMVGQWSSTGMPTRSR